MATLSEAVFRLRQILSEHLPTGTLAAQGRRWHLAVTRLPDLSRREEQVLVLLGLGVSNRQAAAILDVSERTIKCHISNILAKLSLESRLQIGLIAQMLLLDTMPTNARTPGQPNSSS
jgi:DNA-binding NarL/FixJ family response regulator